MLRAQPWLEMGNIPVPIAVPITVSVPNPAGSSTSLAVSDSRALQERPRVRGWVLGPLGCASPTPGTGDPSAATGAVLLTRSPPDANKTKTRLSASCSP